MIFTSSSCEYLVNTNHIQSRSNKQSIVWFCPKPTTKQGTGNEAEATHSTGCRILMYIIMEYSLGTYKVNCIGPLISIDIVPRENPIFSYVKYD